MECIWCMQETIFEGIPPPAHINLGPPTVEGGGGYAHRLCFRVWYLQSGYPDPLPADGPIAACPQILAYLTKIASPVAQAAAIVGSVQQQAQPSPAPGIADACTPGSIPTGPATVALKDNPKCGHCGELIQRGLTERYDGNGQRKPFHKSCAARFASACKRQAREVQVAAQPICPKCTKKITERQKAQKTADQQTWHQKCLSLAYTEAGQPDPFAKTPREQPVECKLCNPPAKILRGDYEAHIRAHQAGDGVRTAL